MIDQVRDLLLQQCVTEPLQGLDQCKVGDPSLLLPLSQANEMVEFFVVTPDGVDSKLQVWPVNPFVKECGAVLVKSELTNNVSLDIWCRGCRKCDGCGVVKPFPNLIDARVIRPEIMPPFTDAMRFVDSEQKYRTSLQNIQELCFTKSFRSHVKQVVLAVFDIAITPFTLSSPQG